LNTFLGKQYGIPLLKTGLSVHTQTDTQTKVKTAYLGGSNYCLLFYCIHCVDSCYEYSSVIGLSTRDHCLSKHATL